MAIGRTARLIIPVLVWTVVGAAQVVVPVTVKDASGAIVHGLQAADFTLGCKKTTVQSVEEVAPATVDGFSDSTPLFVVYDAESLTEAVQQKMSSLLLNVLRAEETQHHAITLLKVTHTGLELINNFSTPSNIVLTALDRIAEAKKSTAATPTVSTDPELEKQVGEEVQRLTELTKMVPEEVHIAPKSVSLDVRLGSLQAVARSLQRSPHRKMLLWVTGRLPVYIEDGAVVGDPKREIYDPTQSNRPCRSESECSEERYGTRTVKVSNESWAGMVNALNDSRISVYTAYVSWNADNITECCVRLYESGPGGGLDNVARSTAGKQMPLDSLLKFDAILEQLRHDAGSYYQLTLKTSESNSLWVPCSIKVIKGKVKVESADGFFALK